MPDFDEIWCVDALQVPRHDFVIRVRTGNRDEPSAAAILNFVFNDISAAHPNICTKFCTQVGNRNLETERWSKSTSCKIQDGGRRPLLTTMIMQKVTIVNSRLLCVVCLPIAS